MRDSVCCWQSQMLVEMLLYFAAKVAGVVAVAFYLKLSELESR